MGQNLCRCFVSESEWTVNCALRKYSVPHSRRELFDAGHTIRLCHSRNGGCCCITDEHNRGPVQFCSHTCWWCTTAVPQVSSHAPAFICQFSISNCIIHYLGRESVPVFYCISILSFKTIHSYKQYYSSLSLSTSIT